MFKPSQEERERVKLIQQRMAAAGVDSNLIYDISRLAETEVDAFDLMELWDDCEDDKLYRLDILVTMSDFIDDYEKEIAPHKCYNWVSSMGNFNDGKWEEYKHCLCGLDPKPFNITYVG